MDTTSLPEPNVSMTGVSTYGGAVRTQIAQLGRLVKRWLTTGEGPSPVDWVIIDNAIRQLPLDGWRTMAHHHPDTMDDLVQQLENWQVTQQLSTSTRPIPRPVEARRDRRVPPTSPRTPPPEPQTGPQEGRDGRRCYTCG